VRPQRTDRIITTAPRPADAYASIGAGDDGSADGERAYQRAASQLEAQLASSEARRVLA